MMSCFGPGIDFPARSHWLRRHLQRRDLNLPDPVRDQVQVTLGISCMKTVRPDNSDPIPLQTQPQHVGTIMIRFVGLLVAAIAVLALIWSR
jgi:hypothetical protein